MKSEKESVSSAFVHCISNSSMKGLPRLVRQTNNGLKAFWLLSVLFLAVLSAYFIMQNVRAYLQFPFSVSFRDGTADEILQGFPATTLCNLIPYHGRDNSESRVLKLEEYEDMISQSYRKWQLEGLGDGHEQFLSYLLSHQGYYQYIGQSNVTKLGQQERDFLVQCDILHQLTSSEHGRVPCKDYVTIQRYVTVEFFNCYTIYVDYSKLKMDLSQPVGLSLTLHLNTADDGMTEFFDSSNDHIQGSGVRVAVHHPEHLPDLWFGATNALPGVHTDIQKQVTVRKRLGHPYGNCSLSRNGAYWRLDGRSVNYSRLACLNSCSQDNVVLQCGCVDPGLAVVSSTQHLILPFCAAYDGQLNSTLHRMQCAKNAKLADSVRECSQSCTNECCQITFPYTLGHTMWPKKAQHLRFYKRVIKDKPFSDKYDVYNHVWQLLNAGNTSRAKEIMRQLTLIQENFVKLTISLNSLDALILEDQAQWSIPALMSQIGGILNLYNGISLIVALECLELGYHLCRQLFSCLVDAPNTVGAQNLNTFTLSRV